jgi:UDP-N-acetylglucosamine 4,6-dehydratase/5-epimerase
LSFAGKNVLITGGTGYLGRHLAAYLLEHQQPNKVVIFSRDPHKQEWLRQILRSSKMRFFIGNVRDQRRLRMAMEGIDWVIHTAAIKTLSVCEYNPSEAVETNVTGTQNVCEACYYAQARMLMISTDKAVEPTNLYGMTKATAEALTLHSNVYRPLYSVVRYGNVMGSTGSVLEKFRALDKVFPITDMAMTRFWFSIRDAIELIVQATNEPPGMTIVGKAPSFQVPDLAKAINEKAKLEVIGAHPGEKLHETLVADHEDAFDFGKFVKIIPHNPWNESIAYEVAKGKPFGRYRSDDNQMLSIQEIKRKLDDEDSLRSPFPDNEGRPAGSGEGPPVPVPDPGPDSEDPRIEPF